MKKNEFLASCETLGAWHFPRLRELPEFELYMDQVIALSEKYLSVLAPDHKGLLTPSMINNYVKSGVLPPPQNKKYNRTHLAMLLIICTSKSILEISTISDVLSKSIAENELESVFDAFAEMYENAIASAARKAKLAVSASNSDHILSFIAIENALQASAARTVATYAYQATVEIPPEEPKDKEKEKAEKKAEKAEKKAEKKAKQNTESTAQE